MLVKDVNAVFQKHYDLYIEEVRQYCEYRLRKYPGYAEDCVQETFRVLLEKLKEDNEFEYIRAFLRKTASNFVNQKFREIEESSKRYVSLEQGDWDISYEFEFINRIPEADIEKMRDSVIAVLTEDERILLKKTCRRYGDSYKTTQELAEEYSCSETAMRQRIFVLRVKIKKMVKELTRDL